MSKKSILIACVMVLIFFAGEIALRFGESDGKDQALLSKQRLDLVFGNVMALPELERALLASMSMKCDLPRRAATRDATVQCLREASHATDLLLPKGMTNPPALLQRLLDQNDQLKVTPAMHKT